jgi:hypothetical protein
MEIKYHYSLSPMRLFFISCFMAPLLFLFFGYTGKRPIAHSPEPLVITKIAYRDQPVFVEINQVPPPFDLAGHDPYVLWVNGARAKVPKEYLHTIIEHIGRENIKPIDIPNMHDGWIEPHFFSQPEKVVKQGRTRSLNDKQRTQ